MAKHGKMQKGKLKAPFMYPGNKYYIAPRVWELIDASNVGLLVEPFVGSAALTLTRPNPKARTKEILNDLNGFIVNFWRATVKDPDGIYKLLNRPLSELDYHACWRYVADTDGQNFSKWLNSDIEFCDIKLAAYWAYAVMTSINDHATKLNTTNKL
jgi:DNA adenine methylase